MDKSGDALGVGSGAGYDASGKSDGRSGGKDERFVGAKDGWVNGENVLAILPPFANYFERFVEMRKEAEARGEQPKYPIGNAYQRIAVKSSKDKFPRVYRVLRDNHVSNAWDILYREMADHTDPRHPKLTDDLKKIGDHMSGWPEYRVVLNILLKNDKSKVRWFDCPADNPWEHKDKEDPSCRLMTRIMFVTSDCWPLTPRKLPIFDPEENVPLLLDISFRGTKESPMPNYGTVKPMRNGSDLTIVNLLPQLRAMEGWTDDEAMLEASHTWTQENDHDKLPELTDIPNLVADGRACELLGLDMSKARAERPDDQVSTHVPEQKAHDPADPFGTGTGQASVGQPADEPPPQPGSVAGAASSFDQTKDQAVADFNSQLDRAAAGAGGDEPPPSTVDPDEPPF